MSLLSPNSVLSMPSLDPNLLSEFSQVTGRYPNGNDDLAALDRAWNSLSYDQFRNYVFQQYGGPISSDVSMYNGPMLNYSSSSSYGNLPLGGGGPLLPPGGGLPVPLPTGGGIIGTISNIGGILSGIGAIAGAGGGGRPSGGGLIESLLGGGKGTKGGPAPKATLIGGNCPPGRKLRRVSMGRDICVKTPRMNPFNPRALARADRRVTAFARRSKAILQDLGYHVSPRKKTIHTAKKRRHHR